VQEVVLDEFGKDGMRFITCLIERVTALAGRIRYKGSPVSFTRTKDEPRLTHSGVTRLQTARAARPRWIGTLRWADGLQRVTMGECRQQKGQKKSVCDAASSLTRGREGEACALGRKTGRGFMLLGRTGGGPKTATTCIAAANHARAGASERGRFNTKTLLIWLRNAREAPK
jgi:hypothetical protein